MRSLLILLLTAGTFATADDRVRFIGNDKLDQAQMERAQAASHRVYVWLDHWSWAANIKAKFEVMFAPQKVVPGLSRDYETAVRETQDGRSQILLFWDVIEANNSFPALAAFEHLAAHIYRVEHLGRDPNVDEDLAFKLKMQAAYLALADLRRSPVYAQLTEGERAELKSDLDMFYAESNMGLTEDQMLHLNCAETMRDHLQ